MFQQPLPCHAEQGELTPLKSSIKTARTSKRHCSDAGLQSSFHDGPETLQKQMISIEMIRERLKSVTYKSIDEFQADMRLLFSSWLKKNTEDHKYFKTFRSITERFKKQIDKAKQRLREI